LSAEHLFEREVEGLNEPRRSEQLQGNHDLCLQLTALYPRLLAGGYLGEDDVLCVSSSAKDINLPFCHTDCRSAACEHTPVTSFQLLLFTCPLPMYRASLLPFLLKAVTSLPIRLLSVAAAKLQICTQLGMLQFVGSSRTSSPSYFRFVYSPKSR